jgi:hypothetical protein
MAFRLGARARSPGSAAGLARSSLLELIGSVWVKKEKL